MFDWLTPDIRKAIYGVVAIALTMALAYGVITTEQLQLSIDVIGQVIMALTALMAFLNTHVEPT